jgi:hypothetical protein
VQGVRFPSAHGNLSAKGWERIELFDNLGNLAGLCPVAEYSSIVPLSTVRVRMNQANPDHLEACSNDRSDLCQMLGRLTANGSNLGLSRIAFDRKVGAKMGGQR